MISFQIQVISYIDSIEIKLYLKALSLIYNILDQRKVLDSGNLKVVGVSTKVTNKRHALYYTSFRNTHQTYK